LASTLILTWFSLEGKDFTTGSSVEKKLVAKQELAKAMDMISQRRIQTVSIRAKATRPCR